MSINLHDWALNHKYISKGWYSIVYEYDNDKIIKFAFNKNNGEPRQYTDDELYQFTTMQKYPNLFVKIYEITKDYVICERLSVESFINDYNFLETTTTNKFKYKIAIKNIIGEYGEMDGKIHYMLEESQIILNFMLKQQKTYKMLVHLLRLVKDIYEKKLFAIDISPSNFGWDKNEKLKMLDV